MKQKLAFILLAFFLGAPLPVAAQVSRDASFLPPPTFEEEEDEQVASKPVVIAAPATTPAPAPLPSVDLGKPVMAQPLSAIDPDAMGLLSTSNGGLGDSLWDKTPRALVEKLLPQTELPTASPVLNDLARRLLLSVAAVPAGEKTSTKTLAELRVNRLIALGDISEAWKMMLAKPASFDEESLRILTETSLIGPESKAVCAHMPEVMAAHNKPGESGIEWQKALILCQLRAGDMKAVQLGLDLMREQQVKDDVFLTLINGNVIGGKKQLPRQLTPLRALNLALLRQIDLPLPPELYGKPDASLIKELLLAKASDEKARLMLAEKAAARGLLSAEELAAVYKSVALPPEALQAGSVTGETGPKLRALLFQIAEKEENPKKRTEMITQWMASLEPTSLSGATGKLLTQLVDPLTVAEDHKDFAATAARILALAGKPEQALGWLKLARGAGASLPAVAAGLQESWPLFVLSGLVTDGEYAPQMKAWLDAALGDAAKDTGKEQEQRARREQVGAVLALLSASGFSVPEAAWVRVMDGASSSARKMPAPSPLLLERLRGASVGARRGETILVSLLLGSAGVSETSPAVVADIVRALRQVGLAGDAQSLAREAVMAWLAPLAP